MTDPAQWLNALLQGFDTRTDAFEVDDAHDDVEAWAKAHPDRSQEEDKIVQAALVALGLFSDEPAETSSWGTHFGPSLVTRKGEYPPLAAVTPEMVAYWKCWARGTQHPRLRARYADAAWDLEPKVTDSTHDPEMARMAIDAYVDDCALDGIDRYQMQGLERALYLAMKLNDQSHIASVRDAIIAFQQRVAAPDKPRCVCFAFDALYKQRKEVRLAGEQIAEMIAGMERQLTAWSAPTAPEFDPFSSRDLGRRLVHHYRASNSAADVKRIVQMYAKALLHLAGQANGMHARHWLEELHRDYLDAGLRAEADALVSDIREAGERSVGEMAPISVSVTLTNDEVEEFSQSITDGSAEAAVERIVDAFTPDAEHLRTEMHKVAAKHPLMGMIHVTIADEFTRARAGGVLDDESGRLVMHMHQHCAFESVLLRLGLDRLVSRYGLTAENLVDLLYRSELFEEGRRALLIVGTSHYLGGDHASCAHVLIPQIEYLLRKLMGALGGVTVSLDHETKTYREKDLGTVLRDARIEQFWKQATGRDVVLYLRAMLTDQRSMNIRNRVCHGLCEPDWFTSQVTDRLIHILLLLSHLRINKQEAPPDVGKSGPVC